MSRQYLLLLPLSAPLLYLLLSPPPPAPSPPFLPEASERKQKMEAVGIELTTLGSQVKTIRGEISKILKNEKNRSEKVERKGKEEERGGEEKEEEKEKVNVEDNFSEEENLESEDADDFLDLTPTPPEGTSEKAGSGRVFLQTVFGCDYDLSLFKHFIDYYHSSLGVPLSSFLIILHSSKKNSKNLERIRGSLKRIGVEEGRMEEWVGEYNSDDMARKRNKMLKRSGVTSEDWVVHADSDQFHELPWKEGRGEGWTFPKFLWMVDSLGFNAVYGNYIDRVAEDGSLPEPSASPSIFQQFPLVCDVSRVFVYEKKKDEVPNKVLAFKGGLRSNRGGGKVADEDKACVFPVTLRSHHFKWTSRVPGKLKRRVKVYQEQGKGWWRESQRFLDHYEAHGNRICVECKQLGCVSEGEARKVMQKPIAFRRCKLQEQ